MKIAVVGAGIFGCTAAIHCARAGHEVDLFDKAGQILTGASGANQFRLHEGYHYPRSLSTAIDCQAGLVSFFDEYKFVTLQGRSHYAISSSASQTGPEDYESFCQSIGLCLDKAEWNGLFSVDAVYSVSEQRLDYYRLHAEIAQRIIDCGVNFCGDKLRDYRKHYDRIVVAAYAGMNDVLSQLGCSTRTYQFEIVEKPVVRMPSGFDKDTGIVVLDGPFFSLDPFGTTGYHLMGHVVEAIWARNWGEYPLVPDMIKDYIGKGVVTEPRRTRFPAMQEAAEEFLPIIRYAEHLGSFFTVRAVLPDVEDTDERPTIVTEVDEQVITVFSGKIPTCVDAASSVLAILNRKNGLGQEAA